MGGDTLGSSAALRVFDATGSTGGWGRVLHRQMSSPLQHLDLDRESILGDVTENLSPAAPADVAAEGNRRWAYLDISNPLVAWLVYRGEVFSVPDEPGAMSIWHTGRLRDHARGALTYRTEIGIESVLRAGYPTQASRLRGFYTFADPVAAERAQSWGSRFAPEYLTELTVTQRSRESRYDANWISVHFAEGAGPWVDRYLSGAPSGGDPVWEYVIEGSAHIESDQLRERAWLRVQDEWPKTLDILELCTLRTRWARRWAV